MENFINGENFKIFRIPCQQNPGFPSFLCISLKPNFVFKKERKSKKVKQLFM